MKKIFLLSCILILVPLHALATIINVPTVEQPTIQTGIDAAEDGDVVLLANGTYTGAGNYNIDLKGKSITVKSSGDAENCTIDCQQNGRGFLLENGETVTFEGLTIKNGLTGESTGTNGDAGGIYANLSGIVVVDCIFESNSCRSNGGAIRSNDSVSLTNCTFISNSSLNSGGAVSSTYNSAFTNCTFISNSASSAGGAVSSTSSTSFFTNCTFTSNNSIKFGGAVHCCNNCCPYSNSSFPSFTNCTFNSNYSNKGGAVANAVNFPTFTNCSFTLNEADLEGGAIWCNMPYGTDWITIMKNCILWGNIAPEDSEIHEEERPLIITYSNVKGGHAGVGNIDSDPLFIDAANNDLRLQLGSSCIDTGTSDGAPSDDLDGNPRPVGSGYDMGAYESQNTAPVAVAGPDQIVPGKTVDLDGSTSNDPDGNILSWTWALDHLDNSSYDKTATGEMPTVANLEKGNYIVTLTVTDNYGSTGTDEMHLCVAGSSAIYTQAELDQGKQNSYDSGHTVGVTEGHATGYTEGHTAGYTEGHTAGVAECPLRVDAEGNKFLDGPLIIENNGVLTIQ